MNRLKFLRALVELGYGDAIADWAGAPDIEVEHAWERLWQTPILFNVSAAGHLACKSSDGILGGYVSPQVPRYTYEQNAYRFFSELGQDACNRLGVERVDSVDSTSWSFAKLVSPIDHANAAAHSAGVPLRFERKLSAAEMAWEQQVQSGMVVGMDDPVWMAKTQEQIDAHLEWLWNLKRGV